MPTSSRSRRRGRPRCARRIRGRGSYLCGPLARFNLSFDRLLPEVQELARSIGLAAPCRNPFRTLLVRMLEIVQAFEEAIGIIESYEVPSEPAVVPTIRAGTGYGATEAPRGLLFHRYTIDDEGTIVAARIVAARPQNQLSIEGDLYAIAGELAALPHAEATALAERSVRNHDPCISVRPTSSRSASSADRRTTLIVALRQTAPADDGVGFAVLEELRRRARLDADIAPVSDPAEFDHARATRAAPSCSSTQFSQHRPGL